ncbi:MAG TPA: diguanylate cyclase response regulator [Planctomycetes bacterium]|nr:diguanylate cyclase response regulator [Planctomycetota bacterium]
MVGSLVPFVKNKTRIDELKATGRLPSPTGVALAVLRLTQDPNTTVEQLSQVLKCDPALSGRILKYANTAGTCAGRPAASVTEAAIRIGVYRGSQIALGFSLLSSYRNSPCRKFDYDGFWSQSLATAVSAQMLSSAIKSANADEAFSFGLLCQIGRLALATIHPDRYTEVLAAAGASQEEQLCRLEREEFALDHNDLTAAMLEDWGLPAVFVEAARCQEDPAGSGLDPVSRDSRLATLLHVARHMSAVCRAEDALRPPLLSALDAHAGEAGLDPAGLAEMLGTAAGEWRRLGRLLGVPTTKTHEEKIAQAGRDDARAGAEPKDPERMRILVVDDDPALLDFIGALLQHEGHAVETAPGAETALRRALESNPQFIVTDWMMPGMTGVQLCKALRQSEQTKSIYVIMLTACEDESHLVEAFDAGADDYVVKPFNPRAFLARVRAARRIVNLQEQVARDKEEIKHYAAELSVANRKLERAALTDPLTGLANRRYALERLEQEWSTAIRYGRPIACMIVDIDHFKAVNDTHGHDAGDLVLQQTAQILRENVRRSDVVCRFGGEEFLVICKDTNEQGVRTVAEHVRAKVEAGFFEVAGVRGHVEVSIGVAARAAATISTKLLLKAADRALYAAKAGGRNRICVAQE